MKMVFAMLLVFFLAGIKFDRINHWMVAGLTVAILCILVITRLTF